MCRIDDYVTSIFKKVLSCYLVFSYVKLPTIDELVPVHELAQLLKAWNSNINGDLMHKPSFIAWHVHCD
jgi:hypothetical protein